MKAKNIKFGIDIGGVLFINYRSKLNEPHEIAKQAIEVPGAIDGLKYIIDLVGAENVYIVSKVSLPQQQISKLIFEHFKVYQRTCLLRDHIKFCLKRNEKAPIIEELELDYYIDDRGEVIHSLYDFEINDAICDVPIWFNPSKDDYEKWAPKIKNRVLIYSWKELIKYLQETIEEGY